MLRCMDARAVVRVEGEGEVVCLWGGCKGLVVVWVVVVVV